MGNVECIKHLIKAGISLSKHSKGEIKKYSTPLQLAARSGEIEAIEILINAGCDVKEVDCVST